MFLLPTFSGKCIKNSSGLKSHYKKEIKSHCFHPLYPCQTSADIEAATSAHCKGKHEKGKMKELLSPSYDLGRRATRNN